MAFAGRLIFCCMLLAVSFTYGADDGGYQRRNFKRKPPSRVFDKLLDLRGFKDRLEGDAFKYGEDAALRPKRDTQPFEEALFNGRHFEVSDMMLSEKGDQETMVVPVRADQRGKNSERHPSSKFLKGADRSKITLRTVNRRKELEPSRRIPDENYDEPYQSKMHSYNGYRRKDNDPNAYSGNYTHGDFKQGRRLGSSLKELASRINFENKSISRSFQNDQHDSYMTSSDEGGSNKHDHPSSFNGGNVKISYTDKIRQLNTKLNDPFYDSSSSFMSAASASEVLGISCDFEKPCAWQWNSTGGGFQVFSPDQVSQLNSTSDYALKGPVTDADNSTKGHFLYLSVNSKTDITTIRSPKYYGIMENCKVVVWLHQSNMQNASFKVVAETTNGAPWVLTEMLGNNYERWTEYSFPVGRVQQEFRIVLEVVPGIISNAPSFYGAHIAMDNLKMSGCFAELATVDHCSPMQLKCIANEVPACINSTRVCDILQDCDHGEDEMQDCDKMPFGSRCSFEDGWCGWANTPSRTVKLQWASHSGSTPTENTGPETDHTCQGRGVPEVMSSIPAMDGAPPVQAPPVCIDRYLYVNMAQHGLDNAVGFASDAKLDSVIFNPPPKIHGDIYSKYYNSCMIRFYYHQYGKNTGSISLYLIEMKDKENITTLIWWSSKNRGIEWVRALVVLPNVTTRYYLQFETRRGMRIYSDVALDDFSMAPECFGINIPKQELGDYNYWDPIHSGVNTKAHKDFENQTYYELTTCGSIGQYGPNQNQCDTNYKNTSTAVQVISDGKMKGIQGWTVPNEGYYTVIVHGAGGGLGSGGTGSSRGASVRALLELHKGQVLYAMIGQQGTGACIKTLSVLIESNCKVANNTNSSDVQTTTTETTPYYHSKTHEIKNTVIQDGGGGGGGASFLFLLNKQKTPTPLIVAGGGGGLGAGRASIGGSQHGKGAPPGYKKPRTGDMYGPPNSTPGAGGGWLPAIGLVTPGHEEVRGQSATEGGAGGRACTGNTGPGAGGFGGGGGGCTKGGAGGGWAGGDIVQNITNGEGGYSFVDHRLAVVGFTEILAAMHSGPGQIIVIPAITGCGCDYRCVALDEYRSKTKCICPQGWISTGVNHTTCELLEEWGVPYRYLIVFFGVVVLLLITVVTIIFTMLYNRYQVRKQAELRHKALLEQDLRLSRLRSTADDSALTNFNPNYGCDAVLAGGVDVRQLPQVARDSLRLVKALGQGAFGEVYQGLYRHRDGDAIEMPVAVKTLPEMSTGQSETDFLMEAAIMAKFNHPNIVHLIGVCFDRHPRFIVLELLAGGDLKNFLRENRPKPERSNSLGMKDLVLCALDVAKGCRYMETKRFIHRDIAARNCLLTSKGPGRVVKIADFGMARDIYRADYYRKGGKAMLPIKWMPPEAFLDGIFTSKTDVWSFGVLLWEVFSLGIMPYTGCANREVMQVVTGGGRLDNPIGCPREIYKIMSDCWIPSPQDRPTFSQLFERLTHCTQDPELMAAPLPSFSRQIPQARDSDLQNPSLQQACGMIATQASDYLEPLLPFANNTNSTDDPTVSGQSSVLMGHSSSEPDPSHPENLDGMLPSHSSSSDRLLSSLHSNEEKISPSNKLAPLTSASHFQDLQKQSYKQMHPPEYGNIALSSRMNPIITDNQSGNYPHGSKFQPSKSTDRLLASMESAREDSTGDDFENGNHKEWETSFIERKPGIQNSTKTAPIEPETEINSGPMVDKLISIDTPQQTPTSLQPPANVLSRTINQNNGRPGQSRQDTDRSNSIEIVQANTSSPKQGDRANNYVKTNLPAGTVNFVKQRPLCLDAAQLEQNLHALKKNSGSVNLNNMNILPPYVNVLTPNKLSKSSENRKIQIDPKKAIIHDLASPPGKESTNETEASKEVPSQPEPKLKNSASVNSLLNGPLTDLPYADSDNVSSSSSNNSGLNMINRIASGSKQNNYTEVSIQEDPSKVAKKKNSVGGFLNNDSEISC